MLRGMGWKVDEGIGGFKKQVISTIDPVVRPKGLGLGAAKPKSNKVIRIILLFIKKNDMIPSMFRWTRIHLILLRDMSYFLLESIDILKNSVKTSYSITNIVFNLCQSIFLI